MGIRPASKAKKVLIAGAGPAGIKAALIASERGHNVKLFEKNKKIGGMLIPSTVPDFKYEFDTLIDFYEKELKDSKVELITGTEVTPDMVKKENPDVLIIATGGKPCVPDIKGLSESNSCSAVDLLMGITEAKGENILVIGGGEVGCETALWLRRKGKNVLIVEVLDELMSLEEMKYHTVVLERMLRAEGIEIMTGAKVKEVKVRFGKDRSN